MAQTYFYVYHLVSFKHKGIFYQIFKNHYQQYSIGVEYKVFAYD